VKAEASAPTVALADAGPALGLRRFAAEAMATVFEVICVHPDARYAEQAAHAALGEVHRLEQELSRFRPNSDVSRVSTLAAGESTRVSPSTMECLALARVLFELTSGAFDVSLGTGLDGLSLDAESLTVGVRRDGVRLDLGGIGKGYAVDRMAEVLDEWEIGTALLHGGFSSVLALEPPPGAPGWPLTLSAPGAADATVLERLSVRHRALSASGVRKADHIVDPRTGEPARGRAVWVTVPSRPERRAEGPPAEGWPDLERSPSAVAEGLSTAFMVLDQADVATLCDRAPGVEAWLFTEAPAGGRPALVRLGAPANTGEDASGGPPGADRP
jgi:thiamine biosynthesis lipoprotein